MEYTKGEWKVIVSRVTGGDFYLVVSNRSKKQVEIADIKPIKEDEANAHLISAAPDMYEALKVMANTFRIIKGLETPAEKQALRLADKALAKAESK